MKFLIILICLGLERGLNAGQYLHRFSWFGRYFDKMRQYGQKYNVWHGFAGVSFLLLPMLLLLGIVYLILISISEHIFQFLIGIFILLYCMGPNHFYLSIKHYFSGAEANQPDAAYNNLKGYIKDIDDVHLSFRSVTKIIFYFFNQAIFAVLFWFVVLGPLGALLYRVVALISEYADKDPLSQTLAKPAQFCLDLLDWIPVRLLGFVYSLVGDFAPTFSLWLKHVLSNFDKTHELGVNCGLQALHVDPNEDKATLQENKDALNLTDRALIVYVVILALVVIGAFI